MGLRRDPVASAGVLAGVAATFAFAGGAAWTGDVRVTPSTVRPGQSVDISADTCVAPATAYSAAFSATSARLRERADTMRGTARISSHAAPGTYAITVRCVRGGPYNGTFVVDDLHPTTAPDTGGGGLATGVSDGAARTAWLFAALAMVVTALGAGLALTRGRRGWGDH
ncbi:hypothetical protein [Streptosporangium carneum]|uniref:Sortase n=1 Tax=Streptosporangium carneum TaxID=47481 RepID=A0A9W6MEN9_9ACTN|nr:hypothetical protein [Streptosporangium carneum]GLK11799.1 hypothetical protein GCM10017600_52070 [Streptosporangium carneum]